MRKQGLLAAAFLGAAVVLLAAAVLVCSLPGKKRQPCIVRDGAMRQYYVADAPQAAEDVLALLGLSRKPGDRLTETGDGGVRSLVLERAAQVRLTTPTRTMTLSAWEGEPVGTLLARCGQLPGPDERLACDERLPVTDGMQLQIVRRETQQIQTLRALPHRTLRLESPGLAPGQTRLLCTGCDGTEELTWLVQTEHGDRQLLSRRQLQAPQTRIELYGTDRSLRAHPPLDGGVLETASGELLRYRAVLQCEATAYSCEGYVGTTATGSRARVGAIAVDPAVIPYGTCMYIVSNDGQYLYGYATAEDTGAFSGNRIDLYFETEAECWQFGRRMCTVYILS